MEHALAPGSTLLAQAKQDLADLVRIPSVSADPDRDADVTRSAEQIAAMAEQAGAHDCQVLRVDGGKPAVLARWHPPAGAPTVLLYAHHDVQPAGDPDRWDSAPFEPEERSGRLYGRGAADDKAGVMAHLAAIRAHDGAPPVGVTLLVEGEEEVGSPTFRAFLRTHRDRLAADVIVVADSSNWESDVPALTTSLRGMVTCTVEVRTLDREVHSGLAGGAAPDALMVLVRLLATLHDESGATAVRGLGAAPDPDIDYPEERLRGEAGLLPGVETVGEGPLAARLWSQPSITVLGIDAPGVAEAANVLQPSARALVSLRVAPGQDESQAARLLREHLLDQVPWGAQVEVTDGVAGPATQLSMQGPVVQTAREVLAEAFDGVTPVEVGIGGSIPFITTLARDFPEATILVTGIGDPQANWHGPNENMHLGTFEKICRFEAGLLARLAPGG